MKSSDGNLDAGIASDATISATTERYCPGCDSSYPATIDRCPTDGTFLIELADDDSLIGAEIDGRFTIKRKLGSGGMGAAYAAIQHSMDRQVAIKVIHSHLSRDRQSAKRFLRETKLASKLSHPNTVTVLDFGQTSDRRLYMVMELVGGHTLATVLEREGRLDPERAIVIGMQVCDAMSAAHKLQIVHRDLKPSNIMLEETADGRDFIRVLDFGLAKSLGGDDTTVTESNAIMGTPQYIPPELAIGRAADGRADLYSLGAVLYELVAGRSMFDGDTVQAVLFKQVHEPPKALPDDVPAPLAAVIMKLLAKKPENRFQTAGEVRAALEAVRDGRDPQIGRPRDPEGLAVTIDPGSAKLIAVTEAVTETVDSKWEVEAPSDEQVAAAVADAQGAVRAVATEIATTDPKPIPKGAKVAWVLVPVVVAAAALLFVQQRGDETAPSPGIGMERGPQQGTKSGGVTGGATGGGETKDKPDDTPDNKRDPNGTPDPDKPDPNPDQDLQTQPTTPPNVEIRFSSTPAKVKIYRGKKLICTTPCAHELERGDKPVVFRVRRSGYRSDTVSVLPDASKPVTFTLRKRDDKKDNAPFVDPPTNNVPEVQQRVDGPPQGTENKPDFVDDAYDN